VTILSPANTRRSTLVRVLFSIAVTVAVVVGVYLALLWLIGLHR
jgi:di/tricarboxylate transporter